MLSQECPIVRVMSELVVYMPDTLVNLLGLKKVIHNLYVSIVRYSASTI